MKSNLIGKFFMIKVIFFYIKPIESNNVSGFREHSSIISARLGGRSLIQNADTADAGRGGGGSPIKF